MNVRPYEKQDWPVIRQWFALWGWPELPESMVPDVGFVAMDDRCNPVVAAWLYVARPLGWIGWPISDKKADSIKRATGIDMVIAEIEKHAAQIGLVGIMTCTGHRGLGDLYKRHGWYAGETGATEYSKRIGG